MHKKTGFLAAVIVSVVLSGCSNMVMTGSAYVNKSAFGAKKRFAVVSVASIKTMTGDKGFLQMFKSDDKIPGSDTLPILNAVKPEIIRSLRRDRNIRLLSERRVLRSHAYKSVKPDPSAIKSLFSTKKLNVAKGYKYFSEPSKFAELSKKLHVDGVIAITMNFTVMSDKSSFSIGGLSFGRKAISPAATVSAVAYDKNGKVIWKDSTVKEASPGDKRAIFVFDFSDMANVDYTKMHPKAIEIGRKSVDVLVSRLDDTIKGKETSSTQSLR